MNISDFINDEIISVYESSSISVTSILFSLLIVFLLSMVILFTYRNSYQTTVYNKAFAMSLPVIAMITSVIILSVSSNVILSLGMVGALSIIRYRTAIKNPFDTVFMFYAIGLGISVGANLILVAIISTFVVSILIHMLLFLELFNQAYFVIVQTNLESEEELTTILKSIYKRVNVKNKTYQKDILDITYEVTTRDEPKNVINDIKNAVDLKSIVILSNKGDYISE
jgi:uncharacterized membrane protein YhiD involved in acid resistance